MNTAESPLTDRGHLDDWDAHWRNYATSASLNPAQRMRHHRIARCLQAEPITRLCDLGSGQGDLAAALHPQFPQAEYVGLELSSSGVEVSRRKVPDATFIVANLFAPPAELAAYHQWADAAVCSEVLEHVDDPVAFLRCAARYLQPNARLIVTVPGGPMSAFDRAIGHRQHFTRTSITSVLTEAGFHVDRVYRAGWPFFNLYRLVVILRGSRLAEDAVGEPSRLAAAVMACFRFLFRFNLADFPGGWQMIAVARAPAAAEAPAKNVDP